jgi:ATP-dependent Clp protease ATP-binding subunit ClpA
LPIAIINVDVIYVRRRTQNECGLTRKVKELQVFDRFTDRARKIMGLARQEANRFNHEYIGTEHILLGLLLEGSGTASLALKSFNISSDGIKHEIEKIVQSGPSMVTTGQLPFTPRARKVLELSVEEAANLGHNYVGTEHLLLGLIHENEGVGAQVLMNFGLRLKDVRQRVLELLDPDQPPKKEEPGMPAGKPFLSNKKKSWFFVFTLFNNEQTLSEFSLEKDALAYIEVRSKECPGIRFQVIEGRKRTLNPVEIVTKMVTKYELKD